MHIAEKLLSWSETTINHSLSWLGTGTVLQCKYWHGIFECWVFVLILIDIFVFKNPYLLVFFVSSGDQVQCLQCLQEGNADEEYSYINQDQVIRYN